MSKNALEIRLIREFQLSVFMSYVYVSIHINGFANNLPTQCHSFSVHVPRVRSNVCFFKISSRSVCQLLQHICNCKQRRFVSLFRISFKLVTRMNFHWSRKNVNSRNYDSSISIARNFLNNYSRASLNHASLLIQVSLQKFSEGFIIYILRCFLVLSTSG